MRVRILQFSPALGDVQGNISRADALIDAWERKEGAGRAADGGGPGNGAKESEGAAGRRRSDEGLGILVGPEMAFSGESFVGCLT